LRTTAIHAQIALSLLLIASRWLRCAWNVIGDRRSRWLLRNDASCWRASSMQARTEVDTLLVALSASAMAEAEAALVASTARKKPGN
jgi:hypothetical protein